jgi:hypothetical protein
VSFSQLPTTPLLSQSGHLLWDFEGLLFNRFGKQDVCQDDNNSKGADFVAPGGCQPLSRYANFAYTFTAHRDTTMSLGSTKVPPIGSFGNGGQSVLIDGHVIDCASPRGSQLIQLTRLATTTLDCEVPEPQMAASSPS